MLMLAVQIRNLHSTFSGQLSWFFPYVEVFDQWIATIFRITLMIITITWLAGRVLLKLQLSNLW